MNPTLSARFGHRAKLLLCVLAATALTACGVGQDGTGATPDTQATGVITGFGSVIVDGVPYDVSAAAISTDGNTGRSQTDLRVGMVVTVTGTLAADGNSGTASQVAYESLLRGALDETPGANALRVLGQRIAVDSTTVFEGVDSLAALRTADALEVSGFTDPAGGFRATWIRKEGSASAPQLTGFISQVNGSTVGLAGLNLNVANATLVGVTLNTLANGQRVRVQLQAPPSAGAAVATRLVLLGSGLEGALRRQALQGLVSQWDSANQTFLLDGQRVRLDAATLFQDGVLADIGNGARVRVLGTRGGDSILAAERVLIYRPAIDGYVRGRVTAIDRAALRFTVQVASGVQVQLRATTVLSDLSLANNLSFANLTVGDEVLALGWLSGTRLDAGLVQRLPLIATGVGVGGPVSSFNAGAGTLTILGVTVGTNSAGVQFFDAQGATQTQVQFFAALTPNGLVRADGALVGNVLVANAVRRVP